MIVLYSNSAKKYLHISLHFVFIFYYLCWRCGAMNILLVTSDEVAKELLPILQGKGWNTLTSSRDMLIENALRFSPDYLLIQSDSNAMHYRGILTKLYRQGIKPFIIFFDISDRPTFATSKRLDEPYISLYEYRERVLDALFAACKALNYEPDLWNEFKEDDYIETTSLTFNRGEHMREMVSGVQENEFLGIVNKLNLPFTGQGYYLLTMTAIQKFNIDYYNNRRIYYFLEVIKAKAIWALLDRSTGGILFRGHSRNVECVLFNAPRETSERKSQEMLNLFLNHLFLLANDGLTSFVLSAPIISPQEISSAYQLCTSANQLKIFYPNDPVIRLQYFQRNISEQHPTEDVENILNLVREFDIDTSLDEFQNRLSQLFTIVQKTRDVSILNYCYSTLNMSYNRFCSKHRLTECYQQLPSQFEWNTPLKEVAQFYYAQFVTAQELARNRHSYQDDSINKVITYIHKHYDKHLSLEILAKEIGFNESYLSRKFKMTVGINLSEYIENYRIEKAKVILEASGKKIYEAATAVGFTDARLFAKRFKLATGMTPSAYSKAYMKL